MTDERTYPRCTYPAPGVCYAEFATEYVDGYRVTVGWSAEDDAWIARCSGISTGDVIGDGLSKEAALLSLVCALAATVDAVNPPIEEHTPV